MPTNSEELRKHVIDGYCAAQNVITVGATRQTRRGRDNGRRPAAAWSRRLSATPVVA